jgi:hypothetical protein
MSRTKSETPDDDGEPAPGGTPNFFRNLVRTLEVADTAAADAVVITISVATLLPVIQAMMSFTETSAEASRAAARANASLDTLSLGVLADACKSILGAPAPTRDMVYDSKIQQETSVATPPVVT